MKNNLKVSNISKSFDSQQVLENINFDAFGGEVFGVFGENGSGKTTLLKIISGLMKPDSGDVKFNEENITKTRSKVLFIGHEPSLYRYMTVSENLMFWGRIWGHNISEREMKSALSFFGIDNYANRMVGELSQGTKKKVALAKSFVIRPKVLVVDEPFSNLDEDSRKRVAELINSMKEEGNIIVFSSPEEYDILKPVKKLILKRQC